MIERSLILIKHDGVLKGLIGEVVKRFETVNLKIIGMKMVLADERLADRHYLLTDEWAASLAVKTRKGLQEKGLTTMETDKEIAQRIKGWNTTFLKEGPVVALVVEGPHAIELVRKLVGHTEPRQAAPGTIRGDFSLESYAFSDMRQRPVRNIVHASGNVAEAQREISLWFGNQELYKYKGLHDFYIS